MKHLTNKQKYLTHKASKTIKYLGISLTKGVRDPCTTIYKTLMKVIEDGLFHLT